MDIIVVIRIIVFVTGLVSCIFQFHGIQKGLVNPPKASWYTWFAIGVAFIFMNVCDKGIGDMTSLMAMAMTLGNVFILGLALRSKQQAWMLKDTIISLIATIVVVVWAYVVISYDLIRFNSDLSKTNPILFDQVTGVSYAILYVVHFIGVANHWQKVVIDPWTESVVSWWFRFISCLFTIIGICLAQSLQPDKDLMGLNLVMPVYGVVTTMVLLALIWYRRKFIKKPGV